MNNNNNNNSPRGTPSLADDLLVNSILTNALLLKSSPSFLTNASLFKKSISNKAANGIHQQEHPPSTPTHNDGIKEQEHPPSNPTLNEDYADEFEMGRDNTDEFDCSRYKLSPSFSQRDLELSTPDAVPSCDYQKMPEAERNRLLRKLKKELDDESMLSGLGIKEDKNFDTASESSGNPSIYSDDDSTAFNTETSTAFEYEEYYNTQECCLADLCMSLITGDYKVEVEDVNKESNQRARSNEMSWHKEEEQIGKDCSGYSKGSRCYESRVLWYLDTVLTYQSHVTS